MQADVSTPSPVTKSDFIREISRVLDMPLKEAEAVLDHITSSMIRALKNGDSIEVRGFGSFRTRERKARTGRNPKTGVKVSVPSKTIVFFRPSKELKELVNSSVERSHLTTTAVV